MGKNILLLDDDKQFCKLMASVLEGRGHKVLQADSGEKGWETLNKENLDLVIVCGAFADKTGVDWISDIREKGNDIRCVFVGQSQKDVQINKAKLENDSRYFAHSSQTSNSICIRRSDRRTVRRKRGGPSRQAQRFRNDVSGARY